MVSRNLKLLFVFALGAVDGLFVGLVLEEVRFHYRVSQLLAARRDFQEHHNWTIDVFEPPREAIVPMLCMLVFAVSSVIVYRFFAKRPQSLLWAWMILAGVALWAGYFMSTFSPNIFSFVWLFAAAQSFIETRR